MYAYEVKLIVSYAQTAHSVHIGNESSRQKKRVAIVLGLYLLHGGYKPNNLPESRTTQEHRA